MLIHIIQIIKWPIVIVVVLVVTLIVFRNSLGLFISKLLKVKIQNKAGMFEKVGRIYASMKLYDLAAEAYKSAGNHEKTGEYLAMAKRPLDAAQAFEKAGDLVKANTARAEYFGGTGEFRKAAEMFEKAGEYELSAQMYESAQDLEHAAALYQRAGNFEKVRQLSALADGEKNSAGTQIKEKKLAETAEPSLKFGDIDSVVRAIRKLPPQRQMNAAESIVRYRIVKEIGRGSMGRVYEAYDSVLERKVAYKIPSLDLSHRAALVNDFLMEAKAVAALNHPNIVIVYDAGKQNEDYYLAMELLSGKTLKDILLEKGHLSVSEALKISEQLLRVLVYAHSKNLIHRDIKPGNIMITDDGIVKLMDFGLAKIIYDTSQNTTEIIGTPYYMSPEQIKGEKINFATDIYSFGAVLYESLAGVPPFSKGDIYYHHMHSPSPSLKSTLPSIPDGIDALIRKCLQKEPGRRFSSTSELLAVILSLKKLRY